MQQNDNIYSYRLVEGSHRKTKWGLLQKKCVLDFCRSEDSSSIDSNSRKIIDVNGEKHVGRVGLAKTINEQYKMFLTSEIVEDNLRQEPSFVVLSVSFYYHNRCPCVSSSVLQSCVDIPMSKTMHYMRVLRKVIRKRPEIKEALDNCQHEQHKQDTNDQWQTYLASRADDLIEYSCCGHTAHPHLKYGAGSSMRIPKLLRWDCVNNICEECGIERKLKMTTCKILSESNLSIDVLEWIDAPRQGVNK